MEPIEPKPEMFLWNKADPIRKVNIAEHQPQFRTLPSLVTLDGRLVSQWKPDANDLELLNRGVPLTLIVHTYNQINMPPVVLAVGGWDMRNGKPADDKR